LGHSKVCQFNRCILTHDDRCYTSINAIVKAELFPTEIRALGVGLPYALTVAIFVGTAEFIALWLKSIGMESLFYFYVAGCIAISFITYWCMDESSKNSQIEAELGGGDQLVNNKSS
jgi:MHS family alpha-ketoglutarate permease-like MFS transporter